MERPPFEALAEITLAICGCFSHQCLAIETFGENRPYRIFEVSVNLSIREAMAGSISVISGIEMPDLILEICDTVPISLAVDAISLTVDIFSSWRLIIELITGLIFIRFDGIGGSGCGLRVTRSSGFGGSGHGLCIGGISSINSGIRINGLSIRMGHFLIINARSSFHGQHRKFPLLHKGRADSCKASFVDTFRTWPETQIQLGRHGHHISNGRKISALMLYFFPSPIQSVAWYRWL